MWFVLMLTRLKRTTKQLSFTYIYVLDDDYWKTAVCQTVVFLLSQPLYHCFCMFTMILSFLFIFFIFVFFLIFFYKKKGRSMVRTSSCSYFTVTLQPRTSYRCGLPVPASSLRHDERFLSRQDGLRFYNIHFYIFFYKIIERFVKK